MERGRYRAQGSVGWRRRRGQVRVTFQANEHDLGPCKHSRIGGAMRLMAGDAPFQANRSVLKRKWSPFVAVAFEATGLIGIDGLNISGEHAAVRVVAVDTRHGAERHGRGAGQPVLVRTLETRPDIGMAAGALCIDLGGLTRQQAFRTVLVDEVTSRTTHLVLGMTVVDAADVRGLVEMAGEADAVHLGRPELCRITDVGRIHRLGVFTARSVAGFTCLRRTVVFLVRLHQLMWILLECFEGILVAGLAGFGADIARVGVRGLHMRGGLRLRERRAQPYCGS